MPTDFFGFRTIEAFQINWDQDINVNFMDIDFLLSGHIGTAYYTPKLTDATVNNLQDLLLLPIPGMSFLSGIPLTPAGMNLLPYASSFNQWTLSNCKKKITDWGVAKLEFTDYGFAETEFTTTSLTEYKVGIVGKNISQVKIYNDSETHIINTFPNSVTLQENTSYKFRIINSSVPAYVLMPIVANETSHFPVFCTHEVAKYSTEIKWENIVLGDFQFAGMYILMPGSPEYGRLFATDNLEVKINPTRDQLIIGAFGTDYTYSMDFPNFSILLLHIQRHNTDLRVTINNQFTAKLTVSNSELYNFGFYNGAINGYLLGFGLKNGFDRDVLFPPPLYKSKNEVLYINDFTIVPQTVDTCFYLSGEVSGTTYIRLTQHPRLGQKILFKDIQGEASSKPLVIQCYGTTIDGSSEKRLDANNGSLSLVFDGNKWFSL